MNTWTDEELELMYMESGTKIADELEHYYYNINTEWKEVN